MAFVAGDGGSSGGGAAETGAAAGAAVGGSETDTAPGGAEIRDRDTTRDETITAPGGTVELADFTNAQHSHQNATGGGQLTTAAIASGVFDAARLPTATTSVQGAVKQAAAQADSTAVDVAGIVADFNALLAKLRTAGILAP